MSDLPAPAATAARAILAAVVRQLITVAGTTFIAHGLLDQATFNGASEAVVQYLAGGLMIGASAAWSVARARWTHTRFSKAWAVLNGQPDPQP